jgi:hypothetical protein
MCAVEVYAVAVCDVERRRATDWLATSGALPLRQTLAVPLVLVVFELAPRKIHCLAGSVKAAPIRQRLAI